MSTPLELRVMMGLQSGARLGLAPGRHVLGSAEGADVILAGPRIKGEHAALSVSGERVTITPLAGTVRLADGQRVAAETAIAANQPIECDGVWIVVSPAANPWPDLADLMVPERPGGALEPAPVSATTVVAPTGQESPGPETYPVQSAPGVLRWLVPAAAVLFLVIICAGWLIRGSEAVPAKEEATKGQKAAGAGEQIRERLKRMGIADRVTAQAIGPNWALTGNVANESERDALRKAMANVTPPPMLQVVTDEEVYANAGNVLARSRLPVRLTPTSPGRAKLLVAAPSVEAGEQLAQTLRDELSGLKELDTEVLTPARLAPDLQQLVAREGLGDKVKISPLDKSSPHLLASGRLGNPDLERWKRVAAEFARRHGSFVTVQTAFTYLSPPLPFIVRTVIGGETPNVVTTDGERVFEGGSLKGYRLASITEDEVVFENGASRVVIPRPKPAEAERNGERKPASP